MSISPVDILLFVLVAIAAIMGFMKALPVVIEFFNQAMKDGWI